jgi:hypothetical protein
MIRSESRCRLGAEATEERPDRDLRTTPDRRSAAFRRRDVLKAQIELASVTAQHQSARVMHGAAVRSWLGLRRSSCVGVRGALRTTVTGWRSRPWEEAGTVTVAPQHRHRGGDRVRMGGVGVDPAQRRPAEEVVLTPFARRQLVQVHDESPESAAGRCVQGPEARFAIMTRRRVGGQHVLPRPTDRPTEAEPLPRRGASRPCTQVVGPAGTSIGCCHQRAVGRDAASSVLRRADSTRLTAEVDMRVV